MSEKNCACKCNPDTKELPVVVIGGILVYELAIIIVLLILLYLEFDASSEIAESTTTSVESEETGNESSF